jgi:hypothetical protein
LLFDESLKLVDGGRARLATSAVMLQTGLGIGGKGVVLLLQSSKQQRHGL